MFWSKKQILNLSTVLMFVASLLLIGSSNANADYVFGEPTVITTTFVTAPSVSTDGLTIYVDALDGASNWGIWANTRETIHDDWAEENGIYSTPPNSSYSDGNPDISADDLTLFFDSDRPGGPGGVSDIWQTTRATTDDPWSEPVNLGPTINGPYFEAHPSISPDGLSLFFCSDRPGGYGDRDIYLSTRVTVNDSWSEPVNLGPIVNSPSLDDAPDISSDGLTLFFASDRPGGYGGEDIYVTRRATTDEPWGVPKNLGPVINTSGSPYNDTPCISADGSILYWWSQIGRLRQVPIIPIVDLNGDGIVDCVDMCTIVDNWSTDNSLCDIGPMPFGNGSVDVQDLIVLSEYLFEDVNDPTLIAHWALDEAEGSMAKDSVSGEDSFVMGEPVWQPDGGMIGGALELDGIDDCIISSISPNPVAGSFSIVTWIKGGAPGQVIISQPGSSDWLAVDTEGKLMTELNVLDQSTATLLSQALVTDDQWHRIGLMWDGSKRMLSVDGVEVAKDTQDGQGVYGSGLYIGVGKDYAAGTYFSGLTDDVRIYNRVVSP